MKYLTKDWFNKCRLLTLIAAIRPAKALNDKVSDTTYKKLYEIRLKEFIKEEKTSTVFDRKYATELFAHKISENERLLNFLPRETAGRLSDLKYIAIGYCSENEKVVLNEYFTKEMTSVETVAEYVNENNFSASGHLHKRIDFDDLTELSVCGLSISDDNISLSFEEFTIDVFLTEIIEMEEKHISVFDYDDPYSEMTVLHAVELYYDNEKATFELHCLFDNLDEYENSNLWYLTVECTDIVMNYD